jgi:hypothetical protein
MATASSLYSLCSRDIQDTPFTLVPASSQPAIINASSTSSTTRGPFAALFMISILDALSGETDMAESMSTPDVIVVSQSARVHGFLCTEGDTIALLFAIFLVWEFFHKKILAHKAMRSA